MQIENELISLDPHFFERIDDYLAHVKDLQLKLGDCGKNFSMKYGQLIELVLINLRTPYDVLYSTFCTNFISCKEDSKDYTFDLLAY